MSSFDWKALNGIANAVFENGMPVHLGNLNGELSACRDGDLVLAPMVDIGWVRCSGDDAKSFLHNQLTSDVNHLAADHWQHSSWCNAKGRMLASFILSRPKAEETYLLQMAAELTSSILKRLRMFVLRSKVVLDDLSTTHVGFGLAGKNSAEALISAHLPVPENDNGTSLFPDGYIFRLAPDRFQIIVANEAALTIWSKLTAAATPVGLFAWRWLNIHAGIPLVRQATQEEFVPQMINFDKLGGVSFQKGCYPGQEIVSRTQYLGKVKRHLYRGHAQEALAAGIPLYAENSDSQQTCGIVVDAAPCPDGGWDALAVMLETAVGNTVRCARADGQPLLSITSVAV